MELSRNAPVHVPFYTQTLTHEQTIFFTRHYQNLDKHTFFSEAT